MFIGGALIAASLWFGYQSLDRRGVFAPRDAQRSAPAAEASIGARIEAPAAATPPAIQAPQAEALPWYERLTFFGTERSVSDVGHLNLLFVSGSGTDSRQGFSSRLYITREAPDTEQARLMTEVGKAMETSFIEGLRYVRKLPRHWEHKFSLRLSFEDKFSSKDGGSAGVGFTVAMLAAIQNFEIDPAAAVTGDLTVDGSVQPVGGVVEKIRGAIEGKCAMVILPARNAHEVVDFALLDGTPPLWETQIFSAATIEEASVLLRRDRPEALAGAIARFRALRARLPKIVTPNYLGSPIVQAELSEIVAAAPSHLSARTLLRAARGEMPAHLSLPRSIEETLAASHLFISEVINPTPRKSAEASGPGITIFPEREYWQMVKALDRLSPLLDRRAVELRSSCAAYSAALRDAWSEERGAHAVGRARGQGREWQIREMQRQEKLVADLGDARSRLLLALRKLDTDGSLMKELRRP